MLDLISQMCADGTATLIPEPLGDPSRRQECHVVFFEAVVCRLRASAVGLEMEWLSGPPDAPPKVSHREVFAWEAVKARVRHHEDFERRAVSNQWDILNRVSYISERATPETVRREIFFASRHRGPTGPWIENADGEARGEQQ